MEEENTKIEEISFQCYMKKEKKIEEHVIPLEEFLLSAKKIDSKHSLVCLVCGSNVDSQFVRNGEWNTKLEKVTYINGKIDGLYEKYYSNDKLYERSNYDNGVLNGLCEFWYDTTGKKMKQMTYKNGKLDGVYKYWCEDVRI